MDFTDLQNKIVKNALNYGKKFNITIDQEFAILKLLEEIGEFSEAMLTFSGKSRPEKLLPPTEAKKQLASELADVVGMAIVNAHVLDINLEEALHEKWIKEH